MSSTLSLSFMQRCNTVCHDSCAIHYHVVRVRSVTNRRIREPTQRFIRRRDDMPKPGQPGQAPRPAGAGNPVPNLINTSLTNLIKNVAPCAQPITSNSCSRIINCVTPISSPAQLYKLLLPIYARQCLEGLPVAPLSMIV